MVFHKHDFWLSRTRNECTCQPDEVCKYRILDECLLISSLPGKALKCLLTVRGLLSDSTSVLKAEPGKLDIKRREPVILFISLPIVSLFKLAIMA